MYLNKEIIDAVSTKFPFVGDSFKLRHPECTPFNKSPALVVTKTKSGWVWYCHRCSKHGVISDSNRSPSQTQNALKQLKWDSPVKEMESVTIPSDIIYMSDSSTVNNNLSSLNIPIAAYNWLWQYMIDDDTLKEHNVGWSSYYERIIIPIYRYNDLGKRQELIGLVGRNVDNLSKDERVQQKKPKYIVQKLKGAERCYFVAPGLYSTRIIIVEDCISAMRVSKATGHTAIALLSTHSDSSLIKWCRGKLVFIWLDNDAKAKSLKMVQRFTQLGVNAKYITSEYDPKCYIDEDIKKYVKKVEKLFK